MRRSVRPRSSIDEIIPPTPAPADSTLRAGRRFRAFLYPVRSQGPGAPRRSVSSAKSRRPSAVTVRTPFRRAISRVIGRPTATTSGTGPAPPAVGAPSANRRLPTMSSGEDSAPPNILTRARVWKSPEPSATGSVIRSSGFPRSSIRSRTTRPWSSRQPRPRVLRARIRPREIRSRARVERPAGAGPLARAGASTSASASALIPYAFSFGWTPSGRNRSSSEFRVV